MNFRSTEYAVPVYLIVSLNLMGFPHLFRCIPVILLVRLCMSHRVERCDGVVGLDSLSSVVIRVKQNLGKPLA